MKIITNITYLLLIISVLSACDKEDTQMYDKDSASANFSNYTTAISFFNKDVPNDIAEIPFYINGLANDQVRSANFEIVQDSTTALDTDFSIVSAEVLPNEFTGTLKVKVNKPIDEDQSVYFRVIDGEDFTIGLEDLKDHKLVITNKLASPQGWNNTPPLTWITRYYLGTYSTAFYLFIIEKTGETQFPVNQVVPGYNNDEEWLWTYEGVFKAKLESELRKYNESIYPEVLLHDDGPAKGLPVIVGLNYEI